MSIGRIKFISLSAPILGFVVAICVIAHRPPVVSMTIHGFAARRLPDDTAFNGSREYVVAAIELTNRRSRPINYWAVYRSPEYTLQHQTVAGWREPRPGFRLCGTGLQQCTLAPSQSLKFDAVVDRDKPCRVALRYSDGRKPNRLWQRLPRWLTQRLPWSNGWRTVATDTIDLRGVGELIIQPWEPFFKPAEETLVVRRAAQAGDTDAQFSLGGRYWIGDGLDKSVTEAMRWYEIAAAHGHAEAAYNLGTIYEHGLGTTLDQAKAFQWYRRASGLGHVGAQERLRVLERR